jgi:hypothetical protein
MQTRAAEAADVAIPFKGLGYESLPASLNERREKQKGQIFCARSRKIWETFSGDNLNFI